MIAVKRLQIIISLIAISIACLHLIFPSLNIDGITIILLIVAIVPWLSPIFKSLEFPGGWKVEFQDYQKAKASADKAGLLASPEDIKTSTNDYSFESVVNIDPVLALAGLRIEIEKRLQKIAEKNHLPFKKQGAGNLVKALYNAEILDSKQSSALLEIIYLLNDAVHGAYVSEKYVNWVFDVGPRLLKTLDDIAMR